MLNGLSLVSIRECSDGRQWSHALVLCSRHTLFGIPFCWSWHCQLVFYASTPTIIRLEILITRAKQACEFPAAHTGVHSVLLLPSGGSGGPSENAQWTLPGIHQRMLYGRPLVSIRELSDGHQWPHSHVLCCRTSLFGALACTPLTLVFLPVRPPSLLHDKVVSAPCLQSRVVWQQARRCRATACQEQGCPNGGRPVLLGRHLPGPYLRHRSDWR